MINSSTWYPTKRVLVRETETTKYDNEGNVVERIVEKEYEDVLDTSKTVSTPPYPYTVTWTGKTS